MARLTAPLLEITGISKSFGATPALDGVDFRLLPGEIHGLAGENGAGKSTLMKMLSGAETPDSGTMLLAGVPYRPRSPHESRRLGVAMIYQELSLAPDLTVEANIMLGAEPSRMGMLRRAEGRARTVATLEQMGHGDINPDTRVRTLSVAQRQVVEIARALASGCRVLILDEPTSSLVREDVERLFAVLRRLRSNGIGMVYISHFLEELKEVADRVSVLRDGRMAGTLPSGAEAEKIIDLMLGRRMELLYPRSERVPGDVLLDVSALAGARKPAEATFAVRRGEVFGIAGLVGAGRTELMRAIFGLDPVRGGSIRLASFTGAFPPPDRIRQGAGLLSEDRKGEGLAQGLPIADNLLASRLSGLGPAGTVLPSRRRAAAAGWIERLGIRAAGPDQPVGALSGGNQQKVAMGRLLHQQAELLLLDEPTRGVDVASKAQIYRIIDDLACGRGTARPCAVVVVSSYLPELLGICDRIAVMHRGRLGLPRPTAEWTEQSLLAAATGAEAA
jgi:ribose transport system ATP-binding protein